MSNTAQQLVVDAHLGKYCSPSPKGRYSCHCTSLYRRLSLPRLQQPMVENWAIESLTVTDLIERLGQKQAQQKILMMTEPVNMADVILVTESVNEISNELALRLV